MNDLPLFRLILSVAGELRKHGSWTGETHIQKVGYFLQDLLGVPLNAEYILYKHGPYSFDLTADLTALRADFLMEFNHRTPGYGPGLVPTPTSAELRARYPRTLANNSRQIEFIARAFGARGVTELEKLATALFVTREMGDTTEISKRASRIHELKPHVSELEALTALQELERIKSEAKSLTPQATHA